MDCLPTVHHTEPDPLRNPTPGPQGHTSLTWYTRAAGPPVPDMEWRYEMPDFFWKQKVLNQAYSYGMATPFSTLVKDERLLTMYPKLKDYKLFVKLLPPGSMTLGYFDDANKTLVVPIINGDDKCTIWSQC